MKSLFYFLALVLLTSCVSFAPFSNPYTGRSNGKGKVNLDLGTTSLTQYHSRVGVGMTEDWDAGALLEMGGMGTMAGVWTKYSFINSEHGWALAAEGAAGRTLFLGSGTYYDIGPTVSYKFRKWEPFLLARYNHVRMDPAEWKTDSEFVGTVKVPSYSFNYFTFATGSSFWVNDKIGLSLSLSFLSGGDLASTTQPLFGGSVLFRF